MTSDLCASKQCPKSLFHPVSQRKGPKVEMRSFDVIKSFSLGSRCVGSSVKERDSLPHQHHRININNFVWLQNHLTNAQSSSLAFNKRVFSPLHSAIYSYIDSQPDSNARLHPSTSNHHVQLFSLPSQHGTTVRSHSLTSSRPPHSLPRDPRPSHQCISRRPNHHHFSTQKNCNPSP